MPATDCNQLTVTPLRVENLSPVVLVEQTHGSPNRKPVVPLSRDASHTLVQKQSAAMTPAAVKNILSGTARSEVTALFFYALNILGMAARQQRLF